MTRIKPHFNIFILFIYVCVSEATGDRRFSDYKRCADDECSMLLCRGKASKDFSGPDCRFLSFKIGETIYVYYKLSGQRSDVWAGSVGNSFGYFPKDYLNINHIYTEKETEVATEQTDFVCFDTGRDTFESYDVDVLLGNSESAADALSNETEEASSSEVSALVGEAEGTSSDVANSHAGDEAEHEEDGDGELRDSKPANLPSEPTAKDKDADGADSERDVPEESSQVEGHDEFKTTLSETLDPGTSDDNTQNDDDDDDDDDDEDRSSTFSEQHVDIEEEIVKKPSLREKLHHSEDDISDTAESEDKQVPFQREEVSLGGEAASNQLPPDADSDLKKRIDNVIPEEPTPKDDGGLENVSDHTTRVEGSSELKTTLGETFDAVASDDENTKKVTPHDDDDDDDDDEQSNMLAEEPVEDEEEIMKTPSLLTFDESEDKYVSFQGGKIPVDDEAGNDGETVENTEADLDSGLIHKEDKSGDLQDSVSTRPSSSKTTASDENDGDGSRVETSSGADSDLEKPTEKAVSDKPSAKDAGVVPTTQLEGLSQLKTILGNTFDAVASDDEHTQMVTPHDDEDRSGNLAEEPVLVEEENMNNPSLLTFEETGSAPEDKLLSALVEGAKDDKWSNLGDTDLPDEDDDEKKEEDPNKTTEEDVNEIQTSLDHDSSAEAGQIKPPVNESVQDPNVVKSNEDDIGLDPDETLITEVESKDIPLISTLQDVEQELDQSLAKKNLKSSPAEIEPRVSKERPFSEDEPDEQINRVKNEIINAFESALITEKPSEEASFEGEEEDQVEELLEDENALFSSKTELGDKEEFTTNTRLESQLEENKLATPEHADKNMSELKISHDGVESTQADVSRSAAEDVNDGHSDRGGTDPAPRGEAEYSDSVRRLTLLRDHFKDDQIERVLRYLSIKDLHKIEAMFTDLDHQLKSAKQSHSQNPEDLEHALESILEVSENNILDEVDKMLEEQEQRGRVVGQQIDQAVIDEEAAILDDFQEFAFHLHLKYSNAAHLLKESQPRLEKAENASTEDDNLLETIPMSEVTKTPEVPHEAGELFAGQETETRSQDEGPGQDAGHYNKNEDNQAALQDSTDMQKGPQANVEKPLDVIGFEIDPSSDSLDSPIPSDFSDNNANYDQASTLASDHVQDFVFLMSEVFGVYAEILISALPEDWQPGPTFHGLPWKPVVATAVVGLLTVLVFMWRTVLSVKSRMYLLTEQQLAERIRQLMNEKSDVLNRITELNHEIKQFEEKLNNSKESRSAFQKEFNDLKTQYQDLSMQKEKLSANSAHLCEKIAKTQEENKTLNKKISTMHQGIENYQKTLKVYDEERSKVLVLMDEAKLREDALKAQVVSFEKDNAVLKEQKKSLLKDAKDWQEQHEKLSEEIKVYHKKQTELENALVHKENEIDVLSGCIAELKSLESCNDGDVNIDKSLDPVKLHLQQMMDVSRIKATLSVIEDERNRLFENLRAEQTARQELEENFQKVIHDQTNLKNEKTHLENQYKNLQQRLEITTELYHQKENILHQKLTQEELERHEKESKLSEVDGRASQAEEELNRLKQKVKDMQEEMQQNERTLKAEISVQEKKAHENWLKARASERALVEERRECANLRQKIVECSDKLSDLEHTLYKSGPPDRHIPPLHRGDSYGPSPVSAGAPSPPLMIEDPGRPPSGPPGRRGEPYAPRRSAELGHPLPYRPELSVPRTSSPCTQDASQIPSIDAKAEVTLQASADPTEAISKSQRQGSLLPSPIRESPVPVYGPRPVGGPYPPVIRPPNGHLPLIPPGPSFGPEPPFRPPHMESYRPSFPLRPYGPIPPPLVHGPPRRDFPPMGPHPLSHGAHDFPPPFAAPQDLPSRPWPVPSGPLPPPGAMVPPAIGNHGAASSTPQQLREGQMPHATPEQSVAQDAPTPAVTGT